MDIFNTYINYIHDYTPSKFAEENLLVSDCMGYIASKSFYYERETFDNNVVICVLSGTLYLEQYGKKYALTAGQGVMMKLTDYHKYYSDKVDVAHIIWIHFRGKMISALLDNLYRNNCLPIVFHDPEVAYQLYTCFDITSLRKPDFEYDLSGVLYQTVLELAKAHLYQIEKNHVKANAWFITQIEAYVSDHIYEKLSLAQMSEHMHMNKFYFSKVFHEYFNVSPIQFVIRKKTEFSKRLLCETSKPLEEIAYALGFSDQSHFSRTFRKQCGISPLSYRKMMENMPVES